MKKVYFILALIISLTSTGLYAQESKGLVAEFSSDAELLVTENGKSTCSFEMMASDSELNSIVENAKNFGTFVEFSFEEEKSTDKKSKCKLQFDHESNRSELAKYLLTLGIQNISLDGKEYPAHKIISL
jgi:hypothetical protein